MGDCIVRSMLFDPHGHSLQLQQTFFVVLYNTSYPMCVYSRSYTFEKHMASASYSILLRVLWIYNNWSSRPGRWIVDKIKIYRFIQRLGLTKAGVMWRATCGHGSTTLFKRRNNEFNFNGKLLIRSYVHFTIARVVLLLMGTIEI